MNGRPLLERLASCIVLASLSLVLGVVSMAEGAELKFRPASAVEPVIARYLVTLDSSISAEAAGTTAESLTHSYGGQLESQDARTFAVTMTPSRARTLSSDPRVRTVVEVAQPDRRLDEPSAPSTASLASNHLVSRPLSTSDVYSYDGAGNIKAIGNDTFVYDGEQRLVDATVQGNRQTYVYDIYGNRTSATRIGSAINCLGNTNCEAPVAMRETPSTTNHLTDVVINNQVVPVTYDEAGNVLTGYGAAYVYDGTGMVTQATVGTDIRNFAYTADDERIAVRQGLTWTWTVRDQSAKVLRELTSLESQTPFGLNTHRWSKDYVWRDGLLLATVSRTTPNSDQTLTYHYHLDHLGTPRLITDGNGVVVSSHSYYPFGAEMNLTPQENPAEAMKFTGHERDIVAGDNHSVDYMHARYYTATLGRFLSVDPVLGAPSSPQSWNRYAYASNNPVGRVDVDGRLDFSIIPSRKHPIVIVMDAGEHPFEFLLQVANFSAIFVGDDAAMSSTVTREFITADGEATITRYMGSAEADTLLRTGEVPNTDAEGLFRPTHVTTDKPLSNAWEAKKAYELETTPTHSATVPRTRVSDISPAPGGRARTSGGGSQSATNRPIPVKPNEIKPLADGFWDMIVSWFK